MHVRRTPAAGAMNADPGPSTTSVPATARAQDIENLFGGSARDVLTGSSVANRIFGGDGDAIHRFSGGSGRDLASYRIHTSSVNVSLDNVRNDHSSGEGDNNLDDVEDVQGTAGNDTLTAHSTVSNRLCGLGGADVLNVVDGVAGNGIQLEQPLAVRANPRQRMATARAGADFYWAPMAGRSHLTQEERDADER